MSDTTGAAIISSAAKHRPTIFEPSVFLCGSVSPGQMSLPIIHKQLWAFGVALGRSFSQSAWTWKGKC